MITKFFEDNIKDISERENKKKYDFIYKKCEAVFLDKNACMLHESSNEVFHTKPKYMASIIANILYIKSKKMEGKIHFTSLKSLCKNKVYFINYELFPLYIFYIISDEIKQMIHKRGELYIKPFAYLCNIYRNLYNPAEIDNFENNYNNIIQFKEYNIKSETPEDIETMISIDKEIYVGSVAYKYYLNESVAGPIEIISDNVAETIFKLKKAYKSIKVETAEYPILNDFTFKRTRITGAPCGEIIVYNSAEYELIPIVAGTNIANIFVVLRFTIINIWLNKLFIMRSSLDKKKGKEIIRGYYTIHNKLVGILKKIDLLPSPDLANYYGTNVDKRILFKNCEQDIEYKPYLTKKLIYFSSKK